MLTFTWGGPCDTAAEVGARVCGIARFGRGAGISLPSFRPPYCKPIGIASTWTMTSPGYPSLVTKQNRARPDPLALKARKVSTQWDAFCAAMCRRLVAHDCPCMPRFNLRPTARTIIIQAKVTRAWWRSTPSHLLVSPSQLPSLSPSPMARGRRFWSLSSLMRYRPLATRAPEVRSPGARRTMI